MNKDTWDKVSIAVTIVQIIFVGAFTALVSLYTARMTNKLETYKSGMEESTMIARLVSDLTADSSSAVKTDFALLALERYLKSSQSGELQKYDRDMLTGFAQSIILNRFFEEKSTASNNEKLNEIFIESNFLQKTDSLAYNNILTLITSKEKQTDYPNAVGSDVINIKPVNQVSDSINTKAMSVLFKKTCYIQYAAPADKVLAENLRKQLQEKTWYAPGIELVPGNYRSLVKYFHTEDAALAGNVKELMNRPGVSTVYIKGYQSKIPAGQLEIWIGNAP